MTEVIRDNRKAKINPHQKLSILNPRIKRLANKTTRAFTTKRNKPRVMRVNGRVSNIKIGFTNTFNTEFVLQLGLNEFENGDFVFYPNPASDIVTISLKNNGWIFEISLIISLYLYVKM